MAGFGDSLDGQAESWMGPSICPCLSVVASPWDPQGPSGSLPTFPRPVFLPLCQAPASPGERTLSAFQDCFQGGGGQGPPESPTEPLLFHPHFLSSSIYDVVILPFVDNLTEVTFYLPFSRSLCLAFGQTTNNDSTHSHPYVCGMCGPACPVPRPQEGPALPSLRAAPPHTVSWSVSLSVLACGSAATAPLSSVLMPLAGSPPARQEGAVS